jgi:hypothetical protein
MKKLFLMAAVLGAFAITSNAVIAGHHEGGNHKGKMMERVDTNGDGMVSKAEFMAKHEAKFVKMDKDGDGSLSMDEMKKNMKKMKDRVKDKMSETE